jgi:hypothetical protein
LAFFSAAAGCSTISIASSVLDISIFLSILLEYKIIYALSHFIFLLSQPREKERKRAIAKKYDDCPSFASSRNSRYPNTLVFKHTGGTHDMNDLTGTAGMNWDTQSSARNQFCPVWLSLITSFPSG